jgi:ribosome biogenesis GTPase A
MEEKKRAINWYPGHMTKARRMMEEDIKLVDLVIEIVDARIPLSSRNPDIDKLAKNKARIVLLNKSDLADDAVTDEWITYFKDKGFYCLKLNSRLNVSNRLMEKKERFLQREKFIWKCLMINHIHLWLNHRILICGYWERNSIFLRIRNWERLKLCCWKELWK